MASAQRIIGVTLVAWFATVAALAQENPLDVGNGPAAIPTDRPIPGNRIESDPPLHPRLPAPEVETAMTAPLVPAGVGPGEPVPAGTRLPPAMRAGIRLAYHEGQTVLHNVEWQWVPNWAHGGHRPQENRNEGSHVYRMIDVVHAAPGLIAANGLKYALSGPQLDVAEFAGGRALIGDGNQLGQFWVHPSRIANLEQGRRGDQMIARVGHPVGGKEWPAVWITVHTERAYLSQKYALESGVLLESIAINRGAPVAGPRGPAPGAVVMNRSTFVSSRDVAPLWDAAPPPAWAARGATLEYAGTVTKGDPRMPPLVNALGTTQRIAEVTADGVVIADTLFLQDQGGGQLAPASLRRSCHAGRRPGMWISPDGARKLRPGQVVDEDALLRRRTTVERGNDADTILFVEQSATERVETAYSLTSGVLTWTRTTTVLPANLGRVVSEVRLKTGRR